MSKTLLIFFTLLAIYLCFSVFRAWYFINIGTNIADNTVPYERQVEKATSIFLVIGDSSAVGVGAVHPDDSVAGRIAVDYPEANIVNKGINGMRTAGLVEQLQQLEGSHYDLVVLHIGGNDIIRMVPLAESTQNLHKILSLAKGMSDNVVLLTSGDIGSALIFPKPLRMIYTKRSLNYRQAFTDIAKDYDVTYVDLYREAANDPFAADPSKYYAADNFHPSGDGYGVWYERIKPAISKQFND